MIEYTSHGETMASLNQSKMEPPCDFFTTGSFRTHPAAYFKHRAGKLLPMTLTAMSIPATSCLVASFFDIRWALVTLIIIFLLLPLAVAYIYYVYMLTPEAQKALSPKHIEITTGHRLSIIYEAVSEEFPPLAPQTLGWNEITCIREGRRSLIVESASLHFPLIIPADVFPENIPYTNLCCHRNDITCQPT